MTMTAYITKYALGVDGEIQKVDVRTSDSDPDAVYARMPGQNDFEIRFTLGKDAFYCLEDARQAARTARDKRVASLKRQIQDLCAKRF